MDGIATIHHTSTQFSTITLYTNRANRSAATRLESRPAGVTADTVDLSDAARRVNGMPTEKTEVRSALVNRVRAELAAGTYDMDNKMDAILDRLMDDLV